MSDERIKLFHGRSNIPVSMTKPESVDRQARQYEDDVALLVITPGGHRYHRTTDPEDGHAFWFCWREGHRITGSTFSKVHAYLEGDD